MNNKILLLLKNKYSQDYLYQLLHYAVSILSGIFVGAYVARYLGADLLGILAVFASLTWISNSINDLGTNQIIVKNFAKDIHQEAGLFWSLFILFRIPLFVLNFIVCFSLIKFDVFKNITGIDWWVIIAGLAGMLIAPFTQFNQIIVAQVKNGELAKTGMAFMALTCILRASCVYFELSIEWFIALQSFSLLISLINVLHVITKHKLIPRFKIQSLSSSIPTIKEGAPLALSALASSLYSRIDILMLSSMLGAEAVGLYAITTRLYDLLSQMPGSLVQTFKSSIFLRLESNSNGSTVSNLNFIKNVFQAFNSINFLFVITSGLFCYMLIPILYGDEYIPSRWALMIRLFAIPLTTQGAIRLCFLIHEKKTNLAFKSTFLGLVLNVGLNLILIRNYGILGAACATVISQFVRVVISNGFFGEKQLLVIQCKALVPSFTKTRSVFTSLSTSNKSKRS